MGRRFLSSQDSVLIARGTGIQVCLCGGAEAMILQAAAAPEASKKSARNRVIYLVFGGCC